MACFAAEYTFDGMLLGQGLSYNMQSGSGWNPQQRLL